MGVDSNEEVPESLKLTVPPPNFLTLSFIIRPIRLAISSFSRSQAGGGVERGRVGVQGGEMEYNSKFGRTSWGTQPGIDKANFTGG